MNYLISLNVGIIKYTKERGYFIGVIINTVTVGKVSKDIRLGIEVYFKTVVKIGGHFTCS